MNWYKTSQKYQDKLIAYHGSPDANSPLNYPAFFSSSSNMARDFGSHVKTYYIELQNSFDTLNKRDLDRLFKQVGTIQDPYDERQYNSSTEFIENCSSDTWEPIEQHLDIIREMGYNSIIIYEGGIKNYIIFNYNQVQEKRRQLTNDIRY